MIAGSGLSYAGINGTIIAIVLAAIFGYAFVVFHSLDKMVEALIAAGNGVLRHRRPGFIMNDSGIELQHLTTRERVSLIRDLPERKEVTLRDGVTIEKDDLVTRGRVFILVVEDELCSFPFFREDGIRSKQEVEEWLPVLGWRLSALRLSFDTVSQFDTDIIRAADHEVDADVSATFPPGALPDDMREFAGRRLRAFNKVDARINQFLQSHAQMQLQIVRIDEYRSRVIPPKRVMLALAVGVIGVFICGVAIPMVSPTVTTIISVWVPLGIYTAGLLASGYYAATHWVGPATRGEPDGL